MENTLFNKQVKNIIVVENIKDTENNPQVRKSLKIPDFEDLDKYINLSDPIDLIIDEGRIIN